MRGLFAQHHAGVEATAKAAEAHATAATLELAATQRHTVQMGVGIRAVVLGGLLTVGCVMAHCVHRATGGEPALSAADARAVAQGDLRVPVPVADGDSTRAMATMDHVCSMCRNLARMVGEVRSSDLIASSAHQSAASTLDMRHRSGAPRLHSNAAW